jgi:hypothetical protein
MGYLTIAALIAATGIMYMWRYVYPRYKQARIMIELVEADARGELEIFELNDFESDGELANFLHELQDNPELILNKLRQEQQSKLDQTSSQEVVDLNTRSTDNAPNVVKLNNEKTEMSNNWQVLIPDVGGNAEDGYEVNDVRCIGDVTLDDIDDDATIINALVNGGFTDAPTHNEVVLIDGDEYNLYIYDNTGRPLFQLQRNV